MLCVCLCWFVFLCIRVYVMSLLRPTDKDSEGVTIHPEWRSTVGQDRDVYSTALRDVAGLKERQKEQQCYSLTYSLMCLICFRLNYNTLCSQLSPAGTDKQLILTFLWMSYRS